MTTDQIDTLIFKDQAGEYYLLPQETLERGRVPAEHAAELERLMATATEAGTSGADAQGYVAPVVAGLLAAAVVRFGFDVGYGLTKWYLDSQAAQTVPTLDYSHAAEDTTPR